MIRQAVILAAGKGTRIREKESDLPKPLFAVAGLPLLKRTILTLARGGIERVTVVVGFRAEVLRAAVQGDRDYDRAGVKVDFVDNPEYEKANGVSVLAVKGRVEGPFLLSMSDHVYDVSLVKQAAAADMDAADLHLCVDRRVAEVYDIDDATKVKTEDGRIVNIGKTIPEYDCIDCGVFAVGPALLASLEKVHAERGDCSLSEGVKALAASGRARVVDIGEAFWQDVDTPPARARATRELFRGLRKKTDGPVSRWLNRPISLAITRLLVGTGVTPNQMTVVANAIGALGVWFAFQATWTGLAVGAALVQLQSILDGCDGEIARLKFKSSRFGEWLDNVLDDTVNLAFAAGLGYASWKLLGEKLWLWAALAGVAGFTVYNLMLYAQLAFRHRSGNPFLFKWWFQRDGADLHTTLSRPTLGARLGGALRALARRDFFLLAFLALCVARVPQVAVVWFALLGVAYCAVTVVHLLAGGYPSAAPAARPAAAPAEGPRSRTAA